ncbi:LytR family transcriptional regulator OS=Streptomyces microflavus OX=1919 GN=Smic_29470 PE=3 SV=1 [Streptomyces microflavus]
MDAQSRGRADDIDPADQWVLNPHTGNYELRLDQSAGESPVAARTTTSGGFRPPANRLPRRPAPRGARPAQPPGPSQSGGRGAEATATRGTPCQRKSPKARRKKALMWTGGVTAFLVVSASLGAYLLYERFNGNIDTVDIGDAGNKDVLSDGPMNILIIGTDKRTGKGNEGYGDKGSIEGHAEARTSCSMSPRTAPTRRR